MGENMREYWLADNYDVAQQTVLSMVTVYLKSSVEHDSQVTAAEILRYIEENMQETEARLDAKFPQKARGYKEEVM